MKSDDILARIRKEDLENPKFRDHHRIAFMAMRDAIEQALQGGATVKRIWTLLRDENKISCSYYTFSRYVNSLILADINHKKTPVKAYAKTLDKSPGKQTKKPQEGTHKETVDTNIMKSFVYDPLILTKNDL
jgi:hypothetical protein